MDPIDSAQSNMDSESAATETNPHPPFDMSSWKPPPKDCSRETLLSYPTPSFYTWHPPRLPALPKYRVRWNSLKEWRDFSSDVVQYWEQVDQHDKVSLVASEIIARPEFRFGSQFHADELELIRDPIIWHGYAANGGYAKLDAPLPSDVHSRLYRFYHTDYRYHLAGTPDYIMTSENHRTSAIMVVKSAGLITPEQVNALLDTHANPGIRHSLLC